MFNKFLAIITFILICSINLFAQTDVSENAALDSVSKNNKKHKIIIKEISKKENRKLLYTNPKTVKKLNIGIYGTFGISYSTGELAGQGDQESIPSFGYAVGMNICYKFLNHGGPIFGLQYASKPIQIKRTVLGVGTETTIETSFTDLMLGYYAQFGIIYVEAGFFYGFRVGDWVETSKTSAGETEMTLTGSRRDWTKDEFGLYLKTGVTIPIVEYFSINLGVQLDFSVLYIYENQDMLRSNLASFTVGTTFKML